MVSQKYHVKFPVAPLGPLWLPWGCLGVPWGTPVAPLELRGGPKGYLWGSAGAAWEHLGGSLVKEDFEGKTSKLAKAFDEK